MDTYKRTGKGKKTASFHHFRKHEYLIHFAQGISGILDVDEE